MEARQTTEKFDLMLFIYVNGITLLSTFALIKLLFPHVWQAEISASWLLIAGTFVAVHLSNAFVEFFFHRYVLHLKLIPLLGHFYEKHNLHHDHTRISRDGLYVYNIYPIEEEYQQEASFFPWYTLALFSTFFTPLFVGVHILFPIIPIFPAGYSALLASITLYELFHAAFHLPLSVWMRLFEKKYTGRFWRTIYTFHLRHHANVRCNESVSGFFGIPVPDLLFHTYLRANTLYPHKRIVEAKEFEVPQPVFFIAFLDRVLFSLNRK